MNASKSNANRHVAIETLEARSMFSAAMGDFGVLVIVGTHVSTTDVISVVETGGNIVVQEGTSGSPLAAPKYFPAAAVTQISINTGSGNDRVEVNTSKWVHAQLGADNDYLAAASNSTPTQGVAGYGEEGDDVLIGSGGGDGLFGGAGNDWILGGNGNDLVVGDSGNDYVYGDAGDDRLWEGAYSFGGDDHFYGGAGHDVIDSRQGNDVIYAGSGNDRITDTNGNNTVYGEAGDDIIDCRNGGIDYIDAGADVDIVYSDGAYVKYTVNGFSFYSYVPDTVLGAESGVSSKRS